MTLTLERLRELFHYDPETGLFTCLVRRRKIGGVFSEIGDVAGFRETLGYWCLGIDRKTYKAHRLAWLYVHGEWPSDDLDHINCDRCDNRIANLRIGGKLINPRNAKRKVTNTTGFKGVTPPRGKSKKYMARICIDYNRIYLGEFDTPEEAHEAYVKAAKIHYGDFARAG